MNPQSQSFNLTNLTGDDLNAIMSGLGELPAKATRQVMNKLEAQIVSQLQAMQTPNEPEGSKK